MSASKISVAIALLLVTFAGCEWYGTKIPPTHWAYAIFVTFIFLAVSTALTVALELPLFPQSYFQSKRFEQNGRIYRWTGIRLFVTFLRLTGWERMWRKQSPVQNSEDALRKYAESTRGAEAIHAIAGACVAALSVSIAVRYSWPGTKWLWLVNSVVNLYPVMLQRYNRPRVERLLRRLGKDSPQ